MRKTVWEALMFKNEDDLNRAYQLLQANGFEVEHKGLYRQFCENEILDRLEYSDYTEILETLSNEKFEELLEEMTDILSDNDDLLDEFYDHAYSAIEEVASHHGLSELEVE